MSELVEVVVSGEDVTVSVPSRSWSRQWLDLVVVTPDHRVVAVGDPPDKVRADARAAGREAELESVEFLRSFAPGDFDPARAGIFARFVVSRTLAEAGVGRGGLMFSPPIVTFTIPDWDAIPLDARNAFLQSQRYARYVLVNGARRVRPRLDVPIVWGWFGKRVDPGPPEPQPPGA